MNDPLTDRLNAIIAMFLEAPETVQNALISNMVSCQIEAEKRASDARELGIYGDYVPKYDHIARLHAELARAFGEIRAIQQSKDLPDVEPY